MQPSDPPAMADPYCPVCGDALERSLRVRRLQARNGSMLDVAFCETCGCSLGIAGKLDVANCTTTWRSVHRPTPPQRCGHQRGG